MQEMKGH